MDVSIEWGRTDDAPSYLRVGMFIRVLVPYRNDRNPSEWWNIEAVTGISAQRICEAWEGPENLALLDAAQMLAEEIIPYANDSMTTIVAVRSLVVRSRFARGWNMATGASDLLPFCFVGRPELLTQRVRALLMDVYAGALYTMIGDKGDMVGAVIRMIRGRIEAFAIDSYDAAESILLRTIRFCRPGKAPKDTKPRIVPPIGMNPPPIVIRDLIAFLPEWPLLDGIVRMPTMRADGSIITDSGYDPQTRLWFAPDALFANIRVPAQPTLEDVLRAREALWEPFAQFPFVDGPAPIMCALFEQFMIRILGKANRPLYVVDAPQHGQGTGKTLMAQLVGVMLTGEVPAGSSRGSGTTDEELEKRITAFLRKKTNYHLLDNVTHYIKSEALALLTTSPVWSGRILGASESPDMPNVATWMVTLNGGRFSKDLVRRIVLTRLDAGIEAYSGRTFNIRYLKDWMISNRARLVEAILTICRAWVQAGAPADPELSTMRGGFERWLDVVGGVVQWAGFGGLKAALLSVEEREISNDDDTEFLAAWQTTHGSAKIQPLTAAHLAKSLGLYEHIFKGVQDNQMQYAARNFSKSVLARLTGTKKLAKFGPAGHRWFALNLGT